MFLLFLIIKDCDDMPNNKLYRSMIKLYDT